MKNLKKLGTVAMVCLIFLLVAGCEDRAMVNGTANSGGITYDRVCVDGVEYLYKSHGHGKLFAPHFRPDGSLYKCGN